MSIRIRRTRPLADLLTLSRLPLSIFLAALGVWGGDACLPLAVLALLLCWFTDLIDGPLARLDTHSPVSWIGKHDAAADVSVTLGITAFLIAREYLALWPGALLVALALILRLAGPAALAWPLGALSYGLFAAVTFRQVPALGWLLVAYLCSLLLIHRKRIRSRYLPALLRAIRSPFRKAPSGPAGWELPEQKV